MKMFKKILIGIILFGVATVLLLQIDDELDPEVATFLEQARPAESSEAYLYLLGIVAAEGEDPLAMGKQLFASMQQAEQQYELGDETFGFKDYPEDKKLALPEGELFCSGSEQDCWQTIFNDEEGRDQVLKQYATLLLRFQAFIKMTDYQTLSKSTVMEISPPFQYLNKGNRLVISTAIHIAQTADSEQSITILIDNISGLRHHLKSADTLIGKMIYTALISDNLDALSLIIHQNKQVFEHQIGSISLAERDLEIVMAREFTMSYGLYTAMDKHPDFFTSTSVDDGGFNSDDGFKAPGWAVKTIFKPNMSINKAYLFYKRILTRSQLDQTEFAAMAFEKHEQPLFRPTYIRNPVGTILNDIASPSFDQYIARLFDLNAKIAIFNQTMNKTALPQDLSFIQNPYYEKGGTAFYSEDGKSICLTGPLEDDKNQRCLRVKL